MKDYIVQTNKMRTICEVLRECEDLLFNYNLLNTVLLKKKLKEIHDMAKRMNGKLIEYKADYDNSMGIENHNYEKNKALREKRRIVR